MAASSNWGIPKSFILIWFSIINNPFGDPPFQETVQRHGMLQPAAHTANEEKAATASGGVNGVMKMINNR